MKYYKNIQVNEPIALSEVLNGVCFSVAFYGVIFFLMVI